MSNSGWYYYYGEDQDTARVMAPGSQTGNAIPQINAGESLDFRFSLRDLQSRIDRDNDNPASWVCTIYVKQFPADTTEITRVIPLDSNEEWTGILTPTETASLTNRGIYRIIAAFTNAGTDENEQIETRFQLNDAWI